MKMKLTDLASIAEIIAAIGVIFSLIFVRIGIINSTPDFLMLRPGRGVYLLFEPIVKLPIFNIWRESFGAKGHSAEFLELLDTLAEEAPVE